MKYCILMGSPRKDGNTAQLLKPFIKELEHNQVHVDLIWLYDKHIEPCIACQKCRQKDVHGYRCQYHDDVDEICEKIYDSNIIILATPIYSWYCTAPMKSLLDRLVYGKKRYKDEKGSSLWANKKFAIIATCGSDPKTGAEVFEEGMKRYFKYSHVEYAGILVERDLGDKFVFLTNDKIQHSKEFAQQLIIMG